MVGEKRKLLKKVCLPKSYLPFSFWGAIMLSPCENRYSSWLIEPMPPYNHNLIEKGGGAMADIIKVLILLLELILKIIKVLAELQLITPRL
ncbi:MAG: hypothetical protein HRT90_04700 [Candidatus Margulisbacteria bacterium]|nr:hypothetical protein [Candidatus Margulisiibacteriota bacterium]